VQPTRLGILIASLQAGGAERAALGLYEAFRAAGVDSFLLALDRNRDMLATVAPEQREALARDLVGLGGADIRRGTLAKTLSAPRQAWKLARAARRLRLDVVLSIMERANIMNLLVPGARRRILSIRSYPSLLFSSKSRLKRWLVQGLYARLLTRADRIVVVSREAATDFERLFPAIAGRCRVIYNACDVGRVRALAEAPLPDEHARLFERRVVIACGRLKPEKGHWSLVRAFSEVAGRHPEARLVVLGDGPLAADLARLRDDLGLRDRLFLPGFQANAPAWIARSRVFVLPSLWEGFPNALLEALAVGTPVVASDCRSGPRELLAPDTDPERKTDEIETTALGLLVPPPDDVRRPAGAPLTRQEQLLARAIERSMEDAGENAGVEEATKERLAEFAPDRIVGEWRRLMAELPARANP